LLIPAASQRRSLRGDPGDAARGREADRRPDDKGGYFITLPHNVGFMPVSKRGTLAPNGPTERVTRAEAKAMGLTYYCTGKACVKGHRTWRKVSDWRCSVCAREAQRVENMTPEQIERQPKQGRMRSRVVANIIPRALA
jgi:hypothetical protein